LKIRNNKSLIDCREYNGPVIIASPAGGMDIEDVAHKTPELIKTQAIDIYEGVTDSIANNIAEFLEFKGDLKQKAATEIQNLWKMYLKVIFNTLHLIVRKSFLTSSI